MSLLFPLTYFHSFFFFNSFYLGHPVQSFPIFFHPSPHFHPRWCSSTAPPLPLHPLYCKQLTKAWQGLCKCSPCLPFCFPSYLLLSPPRYRACVCVCLHRMFFILFFPLRQKTQKLIKYGTRWSSISLNHHVIKMASLGDQLKRKLKNNVSSVRYLWAWLCKHAPFIRYVYFM